MPDPNEPSPPKLLTVAASSGVVAPAIGACTMGWVRLRVFSKVMTGFLFVLLDFLSHLL